MSAMPTPDVVAAGAVVIRKARSGRGKRHEVLLVHRPRYDDWSFPKGKLDRGEHVTACAVREVEEETGLRIRLGPPLPDQQYPVAAGLKTVHYWVARVLGDDDVRRYVPNSEIDRVAWVPWDKVPGRLTYEHDRETLASARPLRRRTRALVVLRHAEASPRKAWRGDDRRRPLAGEGPAQAERLVPVLAAYDISLLVSSSSTRCVQTLAPYARETWTDVHERDGLSEEDASESTVARIAGSLLRGREPAVLCTHRPVLPTVQAALGLPVRKLEPAGMVVLHHRRGRVMATEEHAAP
jgi:8-oxo-(d)GTP phosphatase